MAAELKSNAKTRKEPHDIPLPPSPAPAENRKRLKKQKQKEALPPPPEAKSAWSWTSLTDSCPSKRPPVLTKDGNYFFSIVGSSVKIYSVVTGQVVSTLYPPKLPSSDSPGVSNLITSAVLNPHNEFQLITGSLDGCIRVWDFLDAVLLQVINIAQPILHVCAHEKFKDVVFVAATLASKKKNKNGKEIEDNAVVLSVSLKPSKPTVGLPVQSPSKVAAVGKTRSTTGLAISPNGEWLVAIAGHKAYVAMTSALQAGFTKFVSPERLTCLAIHPMDEYFATGDDKGQIRLWYCLNDEVTKAASNMERKVQTTTLHWHAHAVESITFTPNGAYLLSGGEEAVLVIWQLHSGQKEFVPRVGSPINSIVVAAATNTKEEEYLLGLADASFIFVSAKSMKISRAYARIKIDPTVSYAQPSSSTSAPLAVHFLSSTLVLPSSHPSSLQTYAPSTSKLVSELEVSPTNRVSRRDAKPIEPSRVERAVISPSGDWMATIDSREAKGGFRAEIYLKIWQWDRQGSFWTLNTRIDRPHGSKKVTAVTFSPGGKDGQLLQLVTAGWDKNIKTWRIRTDKNNSGALEEYWVIRSSFNFRSERPTHISWSPDGSLLAVSLGPFVALYNPSTNALVQALTFSACKRISSAHFVGRSGRYLVVVGVNDLVFWDVLTQTERWNHKQSRIISTVMSHPLEDSFALFLDAHISPDASKDPACVQLFRASSAKPYETHTLPIGFLNLAWYQVLPRQSGMSSFSLIGITRAWSVVFLGHAANLPEDGGDKAQSIARIDPFGQGRTVFQDIFGKSAFADVSSPMPLVANATAPIRPRADKEDATSIFDAPAYLMPPLETLFEPLIHSFLQPRSAEIEEVDDSEANQPDDDGDAMVIEGDDEPFLVTREQQRRIVDTEEMDAMTRLFFIHAVLPQGEAAHVGSLTDIKDKPSLRMRNKEARERAKAQEPPSIPDADGRSFPLDPEVIPEQLLKKDGVSTRLQLYKKGVIQDTKARTNLRLLPKRSKKRKKSVA